MDIIKEINDKYLALEAEIDQKLEKVQIEELKLERQNEKLAESSNLHPPAPKVLSYEEALLRNSNTLKALEIAKARLRSRSTYSPVEKLLQQALENYRKELESLQEIGKKPQEEQVEDEEEDDLYDLVMQNVIEAQKQNQQQQAKSAEL
ncbi:uncharacterized protein LOC110177038 [Drosophila serrata]|uniref:uncharacterized protein LOC110177038 n=1 Tax=Drosophila serrata TaxID=7274 RepID=UPI000A1D2335|nr:uncharacterized protein LOC110177038 [Drosophila serrata]